MVDRLIAAGRRCVGYDVSLVFVLLEDTISLTGQRVAPYKAE